MKFTEHQAKENGKAVAAFLLGKAIESRAEEFHPWTPCHSLICVDQYYLRVKPEPAPPARWSRMEHVPLNAWLRLKGNTAMSMLLLVTGEGMAIQNEFIRWDELIMWLYTTGERDAAGSFIFRECLVLP